MKKLLIALVTCTSISAYANDYGKEHIQCSLYGEMTTVSQVTNRSLPKEIPINISLTHKRNRHKIIKMEIDNKILGIPNLRIVGLDSAIVVNFPNLDAVESKQILEKLGAKDVPPLPKGFRVKRLKLYAYYSEHSRSQVHFPTDTYDGLSYHLNLVCNRR